MYPIFTVEKTRIALEIPLELKERIEGYAREMGVSFELYALYMLYYGLGHPDKTDGIRETISRMHIVSKGEF